MAWSTAELANLASTTVNTIRHYHELGLLDVPERAANGYKQYKAAHLVQLLQIRRLRDVGVPLADIERHDDQVGSSQLVLRALDAELAAAIQRHQAARADIAEMLEHGAIGTVPEGFAPVAARLSPSERALTLIFSQLYDEQGMADIRTLAETTAQQDSTREFEALPADADEPTRERLAAALAGPITEALLAFPWMAQKDTQLTHSASYTGAAIVETLSEIYNPAQRDVLVRAHALAQRHIAG